MARNHYFDQNTAIHRNFANLFQPHLDFAFFEQNTLTIFKLIIDNSWTTGVLLYVGVVHKTTIL